MFVFPSAGVEACNGAARPPPYSACVPPGPAGAPRGLKAGEEPPPPYCVVRGAGKGRAGPAPARPRMARLLRACGVRLERRGARPPPAVLSSGFGVITYYAMDWATDSLRNQRAMAPVDPPPMYSTADPSAANELAGAEPNPNPNLNPNLNSDDAARPDDGGDRAPDYADMAPNYAEVPPNDPAVDSLGAGADAAPKSESFEV